MSTHPIPAPPTPREAIGLVEAVAARGRACAPAGERVYLSRLDVLALDETLRLARAAAAPGAVTFTAEEIALVLRVEARVAERSSAATLQGIIAKMQAAAGGDVPDLNPMRATCPACSSPAGFLCIVPGSEGKVLTTFHTTRYEAAQERRAHARPG